MSTIRPATSDDYPGLCEVWEEVDALHREALPHIFCFPEPYPPSSRADVRSWIDDPQKHLLVAEEAGEIVGANLVKIKSTSEDVPIMVPRCFASIGPLVVSRSCQRRGIGERLMQEAICWVTTHWPEIKHIELNVFEFNDGAIAFYRRLGFRTISRKMELKLGD